METTQEFELFPDEISPLYWANLTAKEAVVINQGGTFSSKSYSILKVLFTIAVLQRDYIITVISNTVTKLKEDALRIAKSIVGSSDILKSAIGSYNSTDRVYLFKNGTIIEFKSFETPEQAQGGKRHILYVNEAPRIPYLTFFEAQMRTTVRTFVDYNPTATFWIHTKVINNPAEYTSVKVIRSWHIHNPYLLQPQRERIENIQDKELWKVYARGLTGLLKGSIYRFDVVKEFTWSDGVIWYLDFGFSEKKTADPTAGGRIAYRPEESEYDAVVEELIYHQGMSATYIAQVFVTAGYKEGQPVYCDHAVDMINQLRLLTINAVPAIKGPGSLLSGILFCRNHKIAYVEKPKSNIEVELKNYRFMEVEGILTNQPVDEYNHHMDGIRYAFHSHSLATGNVH